MGWEAVRNVTSGLTLLAFVAVVCLFAYRRHLKSKENLLKGRGLNDPKVVQAISGFIGIDQDKITKKAARDIALGQIDNKYRTNRLFLIGFIALLVAVGTVAIVSIANTPVHGRPSASGSLRTLVAGFAASPMDITIALDGPGLGDFWYNDVSAPDQRALVQKICDSNLCLKCDPAQITDAKHVTIRPGSKPFKSVTDQFGGRWNVCGD